MLPGDLLLPERDCAEEAAGPLASSGFKCLGVFGLSVCVCVSACDRAGFRVSGFGISGIGIRVWGGLLMK